MFFTVRAIGLFGSALPAITPMEPPTLAAREVPQGPIAATSLASLHRRSDPIATDDHDRCLPCAVALLLPAGMNTCASVFRSALPPCENSPATLGSRLRGIWQPSLRVRASATGPAFEGRRRRPCNLLRVDREPTKHPLGEGGQRSDAGLHGLIVLTAKSIVPPPVHPLRLLWKVVKNAKLAA